MKLYLLAIASVVLFITVEGCSSKPDFNPNALVYCNGNGGIESEYDGVSLSGYYSVKNMENGKVVSYQVPVQNCVIQFKGQPNE